MILAAMVSGCSKDDAAQPATFTLTGYSDINTRTAFGTPDTERIPFVWSAGDKIWVDGGQPSSPLETGGVPTATFTFTSEPQEGATIYYNMKGLSAIANIPAEQNTNQSLGLNGDFGYATVENGSFKLNHATAYLWFDVTRANGELEGATLESITIDATDATIAGTAQWNGSAFNTPTNGNGKSTITLTVGKELATANEGVMAAAVVLPTTLSKLTLTYEFTVGDKTKYYDKTIEKSRVLESGHTYRIAVEGLKASDLYSEPELRVLTFEDGTQKFSPYSFTTYYNDEMYGSGETINTYNISKWSDLIPKKDHGDEMIYGIYDQNTWSYAGSANYNWCDDGNTFLRHEFPLYVSTQIDWNTFEEVEIKTKSYQRQGEVLSKSYAPALTEETENAYQGNNYDQGYGSFGSERYVYASAPAGGSNTFCVHHGYSDFYNPKDKLSGFEFSDGVARVIQSMDVANTSYAYYQLKTGFYFGMNYTGLKPETQFKIVAYGYKSSDDTAPETAEFYLVKDGVIVEDWTKWDLSGLGKVVRVEFNLVGSPFDLLEKYPNPNDIPNDIDDLTGAYGLGAPGYFAYDNIAVWFE